MKTNRQERWKSGHWLASIASALLAGASLLAPATSYARVPYQSARQARTKSQATTKASATEASASAPAVSVSAKATAASECKSGTCVRPTGLSLAAAGDHKYGTALTWVDTPRDAGKLAAAQNKLVFVIQISGDFTHDDFT
jgi:hypothetical protein